MGGLLGGIGGRDGGGGGAIGRIVDGGLVSRLLGRGGTAGGGRAVVLAELAGGVYLAKSSSSSAADLPLRVLGLDGGRLLAFGRGDAAFDGEGGAVGARHAEARGVAAHLATSALGGGGGGWARSGWGYSLCGRGRLRVALALTPSRCLGTRWPRLAGQAPKDQVADAVRKSYLLSQALLARCRRKDGCPGACVWPCALAFLLAVSAAP